MIVLHALWEQAGDARLHFWAESSQLPADARRRGKRSSAAARPQPHPFALTAEMLREALSGLGESLLVREGVANVLTLRLPATEHGPLASPELVREEASDLQATVFASWEVPALSLSASGALDLLLALPVTPPLEIAFGRSLRFWITAARLAFELLVRQCYVPALWETTDADAGTTSLRAAWEVVLDTEDASRVSALAALMPPVCWSLFASDDRSTTLPQELLLSFLNRTIDVFVRSRLSLHNILPDLRKRWNKLTPLPEQWLRALSSIDPVLEAEPSALQPFASVLRAWLEQLHAGEKDAAFRTCFRLDQPVEGDGEEPEATDWQMSFYLQANDDRSLLVPAEQVWQERSGTLTFLKRTFENPQERLLADLGRAARLFPAIEESLKTARPSGLALDTAQAYAFLRESAPLLEQSGFGVLIPPWWQKPAARLGVRMKIKPKAGPQTSSGLLGLENIVMYDWTLSIGDMTLTADEFEKLVRLKQPLVQVRGQWVELHPEEIERAIAFFQKKRRAGSMTLGEALRTSLAQEQSELGLPVTDIDGEGWIRDLLAQLSGDTMFEPIDAPSAFHGQLRPYQLKGVSWLAFLQRFGFGACLADDMGMGKCLRGDAEILVNGLIKRAEDLWEYSTGKPLFDGEGYWADPTEQLLTNALDETTGQIVQVPIKRLYRQSVSERLRVVHLEDGSSVTITYPHKLLTDKGWKNDLQVGDYVCVPAKLIWDGKPEDPDLVKFLAWQISEGHEEEEKRIPNFIMQADLDSIRIFLRNFFEAEASVAEHTRSIEIATASPLLIRQLSVLLRRFGIWMRISVKQKRATNGSGILRPYQIGLLGGNAARKFFLDIGFVSERKQQRLETICKRINDPQKLLQRLIDQEVYYCRIKSIEEIQHDGWVYDFEVEHHHNFVANTMLCHNTIQLITALLHDREVKQESTHIGQTLLICPMSIVGNWQREIQRFAPSLGVMVHHGHERLSGEAFVEEAQRHDVVITTYALAQRDREHLSGLDWEYIVLDEAQNIKNEFAKQTQAIKSLQARHRIALTGTPVENRLSELWSIMEFLNPGYLGNATDFRQRFAIPIERYHDKERADVLKRVIQPFVLRRLKTDKSIIADLPDKLEMKVFCNLTQEQASLYEAVVKEMMEKIETAEEDMERRGLILATLLKLKQVCNHPAQFVADSSRLPGRSGKLARLQEMLEEVLATGEKALIFSQFAEMGTLLRRHLQETFGCEVLFLHGGVPKKQRDVMVQRFQEERQGAQIFILSLKAGGVGLNLTAANHVFHFDRWWNPAVENQATDRAFRIGQTKNVQVHKFVCVGTLEERIDLMIEQKKELAENIVGSGENWLTEMSTAQLKDLFALSHEAVGE